MLRRAGPSALAIRAQGLPTALFPRCFRAVSALFPRCVRAVLRSCALFCAAPRCPDRTKSPLYAPRMPTWTKTSTFHPDPGRDWPFAPKRVHGLARAHAISTYGTVVAFTKTRGVEFARRDRICPKCRGPERPNNDRAPHRFRGIGVCLNRRRRSNDRRSWAQCLD